MAPNDGGRPTRHRLPAPKNHDDEHSTSPVGPLGSAGPLFDMQADMQAATVAGETATESAPRRPRGARSSASERSRRPTQDDRVWRLFLEGHELTGFGAARDHGVMNLAARVAALLKKGRPIKKRPVLIDRPGGGHAREVLYFVSPEDRPSGAP